MDAWTDPVTGARFEEVASYKTANGSVGRLVSVSFPPGHRVGSVVCTDPERPTVRELTRPPAADKATTAALLRLVVS
ncbi:MAG: hypothetical protein KJ067_23515 [Vicinamibacteria bacterium]|nr:hypothetical protein [Vicinamibacteria bacterium]